MSSSPKENEERSEVEELEYLLTLCDSDIDAFLELTRRHALHAPPPVSLELSAARGSLPLVVALLSLGADPTDGNCFPMHAAVSGAEPAACDWAWSGRIDIALYGYTSAVIARGGSECLKSAIVHALARGGSPLGATDATGRNVFHAAAAEDGDAAAGCVLVAAAAVHAGGRMRKSRAKIGHHSSSSSSSPSSPSLSSSSSASVSPTASRSQKSRKVRLGELVSARDKMGMTPLHIACRRGNARAVSDLLALGADPMELSAVRMSPLLYALQSGNEDAVVAVCAMPDVVGGIAASKDAAVHFENFEALWTRLMAARKEREMRGGAAINKELLRAQGARELSRLLTHAVAMGLPRFATAILSSGAEGLPSPSGDIMCVAAARGDIDCAKALIDAGADINLPGKDVTLWGAEVFLRAGIEGKPPVLWACRNGRSAMLEFLHSRGASVLGALCESSGGNCLHEAVVSSSTDVLHTIERLVTRRPPNNNSSNSSNSSGDGNDINNAGGSDPILGLIHARDRHGCTPLVAALLKHRNVPGIVFDDPAPDHDQADEIAADGGIDRVPGAIRGAPVNNDVRAMATALRVPLVGTAAGALAGVEHTVAWILDRSPAAADAAWAPHVTMVLSSFAGLIARNYAGRVYESSPVPLDVTDPERTAESLRDRLLETGHVRPIHLALAHGLSSIAAALLASGAHMPRCLRPILPPKVAEWGNARPMRLSGLAACAVRRIMQCRSGIDGDLEGDPAGEGVERYARRGCLPIEVEALIRRPRPYLISDAIATRDDDDDGESEGSEREDGDTFDDDMDDRARRQRVDSATITAARRGDDHWHCEECRRQGDEKGTLNSPLHRSCAICLSPREIK